MPTGTAVVPGELPARFLRRRVGATTALGCSPATRWERNETTGTLCSSGGRRARHRTTVPAASSVGAETQPQGLKTVDSGPSPGRLRAARLRRFWPFHESAMEDP